MNRAALKLRQILESRGRRAYKDFAESIGAAPDQLSKWLSDDHKPSLKYRLRIGELLGIGIRDWDDVLPASKTEGAP